MSRLPVMLQPLPPTKSTERQAKAQETIWTKFVTMAADPEFLLVVGFCLIGLLIALNLILRFPDFGAVIEQYNQF
jgi:hypothetical protein